MCLRSYKRHWPAQEACVGDERNDNIRIQFFEMTLRIHIPEVTLLAKEITE
jgi:hypothetical protein